MLSLRPLVGKLQRMAGATLGELTDFAVDRWEISPAAAIAVPPVICLPEQIDRIVRTEFASLETVRDSIDGNPHEMIGATNGFRLRNVDFVDGVLYKRGTEMHLRRRSHAQPWYRPPRQRVSGALYESWVGNRWFGNWLLDDCLTYRLAETVGQPLTSAPAAEKHVPHYERALSMTPQRIGHVHFEELILFDDQHNNPGRMARAQDMRRRLLTGRNPSPNPGVFLLRGTSGDARIMRNEADIAACLESSYGFRVMFPEDHSIEELIDACGATRIIAGIEGSQLNHGMAVMPPGGTLLTFQPADRVTTAMKLLTDRWQQRFALVVGHGTAASFSIDWDEVRKTLDLIDQADKPH